MIRGLILFSLCFFSACNSAYHIQQKNIEDHAMVVSARVEASTIGAEIIKKGGNAIDAMVATDMALAVCFPFAGNLGGGGFMVYRLSDGTSGTLDYREKAPLAAYEKMYQDQKGEVIPRLSLDGALAVGVPGTVAGMWEAHQKLGSLPWKELVQPAIDLAENGFKVTQHQADMLNDAVPAFNKINKENIYYNKHWKAGDIIRLPQLAKTLKLIRDNGKDAFYKGETAHKIVSFLQANGGIITTEDLEKYQPVWRKPLYFTFKDYQIITMGPPSSGGIVLGQILKSVEDYPLVSYGHNQPDYIQVITEAERRSYADRAHFLGDPDFVHIPLDSLMAKEYLKDRMSDFNWDKATLSSNVSHGSLKGHESNETTHYSIIDNQGNAVAVTTTLNGAYGSKLYSNELGFFFNNEMDDFSKKPGVPNMFGLIGGEANKIEPEKRMLSSMTPTIVTHNHKLHMVLGTPGGSTIITTVLQTFLNQTLFGMSMQEAVSAPRFHHQWLPDEIIFEPNGFEQATLNTLKNKGYQIKEKNNAIIGKMDAILVLPDGKLEAGADPRGDDAAVGF